MAVQPTVSSARSNPARWTTGRHDPIGFGPPWPPVVAVAVDQWRRRLLDQATGRVLDLDLPSARAEVVATIARQSSADRVLPEDTYDSIVSTMQLVRFPDLAATLRALCTMLAPDGRVRMLEPVHHVGPGHRFLASLWAAHPAVHGLHLERDPVSVARGAGLTISDLQRIPMTTTIWPLRRLVAAVALRSPERRFGALEAGT